MHKGSAYNFNHREPRAVIHLTILLHVLNTDPERTLTPPTPGTTAPGHTFIPRQSRHFVRRGLLLMAV